MLARKMPPNQRFTFVKQGGNVRMEGVYVRAFVGGRVRFCAFMGFRLAPGQISRFEDGPMDLRELTAGSWELVQNSIVEYWPPPETTKKKDNVVELAAYRK